MKTVLGLSHFINESVTALKTTANDIFFALQTSRYSTDPLGFKASKKWDGYENISCTSINKRSTKTDSSIALFLQIALSFAHLTVTPLDKADGSDYIAPDELGFEQAPSSKANLYRRDKDRCWRHWNDMQNASKGYMLLGRPLVYKEV